MNYQQMSTAQLQEELQKLQAEYSAWQEKKISLDLSRGKPGAAQLDLTADMLCVPATAAECLSDAGFDCRNYGIVDGLPEAKQLFADLLGIPLRLVISPKTLAGGETEFRTRACRDSQRIKLEDAPAVIAAMVKDELAKFEC